MMRSIVGMAALAGLAGTANATLYSFASDNDPSSFTWSGAGDGIVDANDASDPFALLVDDDNGILPTLSFDVELEADVKIVHVASVPFGGSFLHYYSAFGNVSFNAAGSGALLLSIDFDGALFSAVGSMTSWSSTAGLSASDSFANVTYTWFGPSDANYGLGGGASTGPDDMAFTFSFINQGAGVNLDPNTKLPTDWVSEGSYSGSSVPAPGALAALGVAGLIGTRRRR